MIWIVALIVIAFVAGYAFGATLDLGGLPGPSIKRPVRPTLPLARVLTRVEERRLDIPTVLRKRIPVVLDVD